MIEYSGDDTASYAEYATTTYAYSPLDVLTSVTDAQSKVTTMTYDSLGRKLTMSEPNMGAWSYAYDVDGNLTSQTDAKSQTLSFEYDDLSRLIAKKQGVTTIASYGYDQLDGFTGYGKGRRTSISNSATYQKYGYNARGETIAEQVIMQQGGATYNMNRTYYADGKPATITYPTGEVLSYAYDEAGLLNQISSGLGTYQSLATYNAAGQSLETYLGNGMIERRVYDSLSNRLTDLAADDGIGVQALRRQYYYDNVGNIERVYDPTTTETLKFGYDHRDRLTSACTWSGSACGSGTGALNETYAYNTIGNLTSKAGVSYTYSPTKPQQVTSAGANSYTYDNNGNMLTGAGRTFTWNIENQPTQIVKGTVTETYLYNADNERVKKTSVNGGTTTTTLYIGNVEYTGSQVVSYYGAAMRTSTGNPTALNPGALVYLHSDHLGSVSATTDATGSIVESQRFTPWGEVRSGGVTATTKNYTGQIKDAGTGLSFYNARYYDAALGRFTSADSIVPGTAHRSLTIDYHETLFNNKLAGENNQDFWFKMSGRQQQQAKAPWGPNIPAQLNRYAYVRNNPLNAKDPTGHTTEGVHIATSQDAKFALIALNDFIASFDVALNLDKIEVKGGYREAIGVAISASLKQLVSTFGADFVAFLKGLADALGSMIDDDKDFEHGVYFQISQLAYSNGQQVVDLKWSGCRNADCSVKSLLGHSYLRSHQGLQWPWEDETNWDHDAPEMGRKLWSQIRQSQNK
ncbi:MAG TPA: RHS repeat-associated core domain-containing protein [Herpetosiphonaceae bacterium]